MKVRISDIPVEGKDFSFSLDTGAINDRVRVGEEGAHEKFEGRPEVALHIDIEGRLVMLKGEVSGTFTAPCARCAEESRHSITAPVKLVLKPNSDRSRPGEEVDDLELSFYDGREVDCEPIAEDALVEGIPFQVLCQEGCKGLCVSCGANLNHGPCGCAPESGKDGAFSVLQGLKTTLNH